MIKFKLHIPMKYSGIGWPDLWDIVLEARDAEQLFYWLRSRHLNPDFVKYYFSTETCLCVEFCEGRVFALVYIVEGLEEVKDFVRHRTYGVKSATFKRAPYVV